MKRALAATSVALAVTLLLSSHPWRPDPLPGFPRLILWAWERPEDLRFLTPSQTAVAFLAATIRIDGSHAATRPRLQPLLVPPDTPLMAVVRIESAGRQLPAPHTIVPELLRPITLPNVRALQLDFDARESEREWYRALLQDVRHRLPSHMPLSITALVSWCGHDDWMKNLPVSEAAPMLFRMGPGEQPPIRDFTMPLCRHSAGLSTDELPSSVPRGRRIYFFNPRPWTKLDYQAAVSQARRWQ